LNLQGHGERIPRSALRGGVEFLTGKEEAPVKIAQGRPFLVQKRERGWYGKNLDE
jgi:hypothetical protein